MGGLHLNDGGQMGSGTAFSVDPHFLLASPSYLSFLRPQTWGSLGARQSQLLRCGGLLACLPVTSEMLCRRVRYVEYALLI